MWYPAWMATHLGVRCIVFTGDHLDDVNQLCELPVNPVCRVEHASDFLNPLALWQHKREIPLAVRPHPAPSEKSWGVALQSAFEKVQVRRWRANQSPGQEGIWGSAGIWVTIQCPKVAGY